MNKYDTKLKNQIRIGDKRQKIVNFIADNGISDLKSISSALKQLVEERRLEIEGEYKNRRYKVKEL